MATQSSPYHVFVWGSTGVVGRLVAEHLTRDYKVGLYALVRKNGDCIRVTCPMTSITQGWLTGYNDCRSKV